MTQTRSLRLILLISILAIGVFLIYTLHMLHPAFNRMLRDNIRHEAIRTASYLSSLLIVDDAPMSHESLSPQFALQIQSLFVNSRFRKLKVFSTDGEVLYSTEPGDIGAINNQPYFKRIVRNATVRAKEVQRNTASLERQIMSTDVVETYVPLVRQGQVVGVFEIYFDTSPENRAMNVLLYSSSSILATMAVILIGAVLVSTCQAAKHVRKCQQKERERESLISRLQEALGNVKILQGLLPICAWCRKVRDDDGYFKSVEEYLQHHSKIRFTHGICLDCMKKIDRPAPD